MKLTIHPSALSGSIEAIASKSATHRLLICAALADRETKIYCSALSKDIEATARCLRALGAHIEYSKGVFSVQPIEKATENALLDCGESGSTLRFLLPVVCALGGGARIKMHGRLSRRPLSPLWEELELHGAVLRRAEENIIAVSGKIKAGDYRIRADISSQYVSGLLFALPLLGDRSRLRLEGDVESAGYIRMTCQAQRTFGLDIPFDGEIFNVPRSAHYRSPGQIQVEGDWSSAAFWLVASELSGGGINISGLRDDSLQGDKESVYIINKIRRGNAVIDVKNVPDLVPVLSVLAAVSPGKTEFANAGRLRIKESDRIASVCRMLRTLGADCEEMADRIIVHGGRLRGGTVDGENDHRIVMSAAVAAIACSEPVTILGAEAADKSYSAFFEDYKKLGGKIL